MRQIISTGITCSLVILASALAVCTASAQSKPTMAVIEFKNKADNQWWHQGGAQQVQDVFITELAKLGKFKVLDREQLEGMMMEKNLSLSGDVDPKTAVKIGKLLGVNYLLIGNVTEYGAKATKPASPMSAGKKTFVATISSQLIETKTGKAIWSRVESNTVDSVKVSVGGFGGGVDDQTMFDKSMKPAIVNLVANLKASNPVK